MPPLAVRLAPSRFLDPALVVVVLLAVTLYLSFRGARPEARVARVARLGAWAAWAGLWVASMPLVAGTLTDWTETTGPDLGAALAGTAPEKTALVVLAAGLRTYSRRIPPRERLDAATTARVLGAARLYHEHGFGLVVLSGSPREESDDMLDLITSLGVPGDRIEREWTSINTRENAANSAQILRDRGIETVVLTTSATHLRRAVKDFEAAGVHAIPAPVDIVDHTQFGIDGVLPSSNALSRTHLCLHELLGYFRG